METESTHWFKRLRKHAVFPVVAYIAVSMVLKENYPFSHFPMYSDPSSKPLSYSYIADGTGKDGALGEPLPLLYHTGLSPSKIDKRFGHHRGEFEDDDSLSQAQIDSRAAAKVLDYIRKRNEPRRPKRALPETVQYVRVRITHGDDVFIETPAVVAESHVPVESSVGEGARP